MKRQILSLLLLALASDAWAHRLDEYLQATRIFVATNRIDVSIDLTPGVAIVDQLLPVIDRNHDGRISDEEATTYARRVLKDVRVSLDEGPLALGLRDVRFPAMSDTRAGLGVIRIKATAPIKKLALGKHDFILKNTHLPALSEYLVNALVPTNELIHITKQIRNENQSDYRLVFTLNPRPDADRLGPPLGDQTISHVTP